MVTSRELLKTWHTQNIHSIDLEFYVDNEYKTMKFLEHWIEFIANGSGETQSQAGYYHRMEYPNDYKTYQTKIIKFDRDYQHELQYTFYGLFPYNLVSTPVTYKSSDILKVTCSFMYDRYVCGKFDSYSVHRGTSNKRELRIMTLVFLEDLRTPPHRLVEQLKQQ